MPNHLVEPLEDVNRLDDFIPPKKRFKYPEYLLGRSMLVKKMARINIECVVRGYLAGSAWEEYKKTGSVCGYQLPKGLLESQELAGTLVYPYHQGRKRP